MSVVEIISKAYPKDVETPNDFPLCKCGGEFRVEEVFNKKGVYRLTNAVCTKCNECFCDGDVECLSKSIPDAQKARDRNGSAYKYGG